MDKLIEKKVEKLETLTNEYRNQVDLLDADSSDLQVKYCEKLQDQVWNHLYDLKLMELGEYIDIVNDCDEEIKLIEKKHDELFIRTMEAFAKKIFEYQQSLKVIETF